MTTTESRRRLLALLLALSWTTFAMAQVVGTGVPPHPPAGPGTGAPGVATDQVGAPPPRHVRVSG